jgi:hypothetical protein
MNKIDVVEEVKANLIIREFKKKERLLAIAQGKPRWKYYVFGIIWFGFIMYVSGMKDPNEAMRRLWLPFVVSIIGAYAECHHRMNALIELIGEEKLKELTQKNKE